MRKILVVVFGFALITVLFILSSVDDLSVRETTLFSTALAVLSMAVSWLITDIYSEKSKVSALEEAKKFHNESLRTYVVNASEKVNNISNELNKLSVRLKYMKTTGDDSLYTSTVFKERVASITHIIETLKSVNDTTINDWRGVIGEEIKNFKQKEEEAKKKEIENLLIRIENLELINENDDDSALLALTETRKHLDDLLSDTGLVLNVDEKIKRVTRQCPKCRTVFGYDQHTRENNIRQLRCPKIGCNVNLISNYDEFEDKISLIEPEIEKIEADCQYCHETLSVWLPIHDKAQNSEKCNCGNIIKLKREDDSIQESHSMTASIQIEIDEDFLEKIKNLLPPQPWEKHIHKKLAKEVGVSNSVAHKAIKELILNGTFYNQIDGELYKKVNP